MSYDKRIGDKFLNAGLGYGGSCFPKDTKALHWLANDHGYEIKTIKAAIEVNENQKLKLFRKAKQRFGSLKGKRVAVLGLTFKPETDDLREAPSISNIKRLLDEGAEIVAFDPVGIENFKKKYPTEISYVSNPEDALKKTPIIFDGRNCFRLEEVKETKIDYYSIGRREILNFKIEQ